MTSTAQPAALSAEEMLFADRTIAAHAGRPGALLGILERIQEHHPHKYLSPDILEYVADRTGTPLSQIYSVVTFYALFNLEPQGDTPSASAAEPPATRAGSRNLLQRLRLELGLPEESEDGADKICAHHAGRHYSPAHRRLLRPVRAGAGGRGGPRASSAT